jgi:hypothetical protein
MSIRWKPFYWLDTERQHQRDYNEFPTYKALLKSLPEAIRKSPSKEVCIFRSKRGEFGEWFEYWSLDTNGRLVMGKSGWM